MHTAFDTATVFANTKLKDPLASIVYTHNMAVTYINPQAYCIYTEIKKKYNL